MSHFGTMLMLCYDFLNQRTSAQPFVMITTKQTSFTRHDMSYPFCFVLGTLLPRGLGTDLMHFWIQLPGMGNSSFILDREAGESDWKRKLHTYVHIFIEQVLHMIVSMNSFYCFFFFSFFLEEILATSVSTLTCQRLYLPT